ncbi:putative phage-related protein (partial), partial [Bordetella avium 197N]
VTRPPGKVALYIGHEYRDSRTRHHFGRHRKRKSLSCPRVSRDITMVLGHARRRGEFRLGALGYGERLGHQQAAEFRARRTDLGP